MIDADIVLIAVRVLAVTVGDILALDTTKPTNARRVESVSDREVVGQRHPADQSRHPSRRIHAGPKRIFAKHTDGERSRGTPIEDGVAGLVDCRIVLNRIGVLYAREIAKDSLSGLVGQNSPGKVTLRDEALPVIKEEEERFVGNNGSGDSSSKLVSIHVILADSVEVVIPGV